jgi:EmrB/QacA subfamily drug resistance transporter
MVTSSQLADAQTPSRDARAVLAVLSLAAFMASLDLFIVNVAFANIGRDFHGASLPDLSWVLSGYAILYAALLVPLGRLADRYGRKAGFLAGLGLFTLASAACAGSPSLWLLVAFRCLQAVGAAALTPTSLGLLLAATAPSRRAKSVRVWAATGALAAAAGPVIGGILVSASWRWVFLVNVPIGLIALIAAVRIVPDSRDTSVNRLPDLAGAALLALAIGALALGLVKGTVWGWGSGSSIATFVVAAAGLTLFWWRSARHPSPVVEPALLRVRAFAWSNVTAFAFSIAFAANLLAAILWMQDVWHYSALRTGLGIAPGPLMVPIFAAVAHRFANKVSVGRVTAIGCLLIAIGAFTLSLRVGPHPAYVTEILPGWLLGGIGVGLALPTILSAATSDLPAARAATGSAVVNMSRQIGTVLGVSMLVAIVGTPAGYALAHAAFEHVWWAIAGCALISIPAAIGMTPRRARPGGPDGMPSPSRARRSERVGTERTGSPAAS